MGIGHAKEPGPATLALAVFSAIGPAASALPRHRSLPPTFHHVAHHGFRVRLEGRLASKRRLMDATAHLGTHERHDIQRWWVQW